MSTDLHDITAQLDARMSDAVVGHEIAFGELTVTTTLSHLPVLVRWLQSDESMKFSTLVDITAVDYPGRADRF